MRRRFLVAAAAALFLALATSASGSLGGDPGVTTTSILLGGTAALSGPQSLYYAPVAKGAQAYFAYVNAQGGVYGRKIDYRVVDDAYDPEQTALATKKLVEQDQVFAIFKSIGTELTLAVRTYLNQVGDRHLFVVIRGRKIFHASKQHPRTIG